MSVFVVAVLSTYRRPVELARLFRSLEKIPAGLGAVVVADNASDEATAQVCAESPLSVHRLPQTANLGCGGGLEVAEQNALRLFGDRLTHLWVLDDDVVVEPNILDQLLAGMARTGAEAAVPMILNAAGKVGWRSGLLDEVRFRAVLRAQHTAEYLHECGPEPVPFSWATGICLLFTRRVVEEVGPHRPDFWIRGEDLEFSLRITARFSGVFVPTAEVAHLPPVIADNAETQRAEIVKEGAHLQNVSYIGLHLPYGRRIVSKIPGRYYWFLKSSRWVPAAWSEAIRAFWHGAILGQPAGATRRG